MFRREISDAFAEAKENENMADSRGELLAEYGVKFKLAKKVSLLEEKCRDLEEINASSDRDLVAN